MKIGIDAREFRAGALTGIGRYLRNFLLHAPLEGHKVILYADADTTLDFARPEIRVVNLGGGPRLWWDQRKLPRAARRDGVEVFFSPYVKGPLGCGCPLVTTIHDLIPLVLRPDAGGRGWAYRKLFAWQAKAVSKRAALVTTVSEHSKADIIRVFGVPEEKVCVVPNCVSDDFRPMADADAIARILSRLGVEGAYLFYIGNFKPHKNVGALLRAFAGLPEDMRRRLRVVLGGSGGDKMRGLIAELGIGDRTQFVGRVSDADLIGLLCGAMAFVFPSRYEGFGLPVLEAMACGTPVICSNASSLPEVAGDAALMVGPDDIAALTHAMRRVVETPALRAEMGKKSIRQAARFQPRETARRLLDTIAQARAATRRDA